MFFPDTLAGQRWRTKLGRPSRVPTLGDVDPTGTYCPMPEDWLKKKYSKCIPQHRKTSFIWLDPHFNDVIDLAKLGD